jgi:FlaA1/EpsC-like NDP-sugar epimerase
MDYKGKNVCVTGAGGSIGSEICRQLIKQGVRRLTLVCLTEGALFNLLNELPASNDTLTIVPVLGNVNDDRLMQEVLEGCHAVLHAAAHKHVPLCELSPLAAIETNVRGTYIAAQAAITAKVPVFVQISTDKAVFPVSVMGATKRVAELLVRDVMPPDAPTRFVTCRFGNVLDSAGSVLPLWREQLHAHKPITLTSFDCERYFMSIPQAAELVLTCAGFASGAAYIFDMGKPHKMGDVALALIRKERPDIKDPGTMIRQIGLRPGEKLTETLTYGGPLTPTRHPKIFRVAQDLTQGMTAKELIDLLADTRDRNREEALRRLWSIAK